MEALSRHGSGGLLSAKEVISLLGLSPLQGEGGYFRETYRSVHRFAIVGDTPDRSLATAIYYLLTPESFSAMHRLRWDEVYHFYSGDPVELVRVQEDGMARGTILGPRLDLGHACQVVVPGGVWQGSRLCEGGCWALLGTTMAPGFDFADWELARPADARNWPEIARSLIVAPRDDRP